MLSFHRAHSALGALILGLACAADPSPPQHDLLRYYVDLDHPPSKRYQHVWDDFLRQHGTSAFSLTYAGWNSWLGLALPDLFGISAGVERAQAHRQAWLAALQRSHPAVAEELQALSTTLIAAGLNQELVSPPALAVAVSLYPILNIAAKNTTDTRPSACTSTLARLASGAVLHGRSLDYEPRDSLAAATVVIDFMRQGAFEYRCLHPLPYVTGLQWFSCVRPGAFSLSVNARSQGIHTEHNASFAELIRRLERPGANLLGEVAERAMQSESYEAALAVLASSRVVSSNYFILAGAGGEGAVITRFGNSSAADVWNLGPPDSDPEDGQPPWLRVQTNVDHWVTFSSGAYATHRRQAVLNLIGSGGQQALNEEALLQAYLERRALAGSENRSRPEDTGAILRPSTIATLVLDPAASAEASPDPSKWRIWARTPTILPPHDAQILV